MQNLGDAFLLFEMYARMMIGQFELDILVADLALDLLQTIVTCVLI